VICVGVSVNTSGLGSDERSRYLQTLEKETGLPCVDSVIDSCDAIAKNIHHHFNCNDSTKLSEQSSYA